MKWYQTSNNLAKDYLVIVKALNRPLTNWRLGRIVKVHPGIDDVVCVVTIKSEEGIFKRPSVKLKKLPV